MKNLGFGCMRLPMAGGEVDLPQFAQMVDRFLAAGCTYFDTAHGYLDGKSETALRACLTSRYPRGAYLLADKLSPWHFSEESEILPLFESQLAACGVDYFDYYLMHAQNLERYRTYAACGAYRIVRALREEGRVRHMGISFHGTAAELDEILTAEPSIEFVQIQFNYVDYADPRVDARGCYAVCRKHEKPVFIMEPVKGGLLTDLPEEAEAVFAALGASPASFAIRYAASFPGVEMVLSGMSTTAQMEENLSFMRHFSPLTEAEFAAVERVRAILERQDRIACTGCRYCEERCPQRIPIPALFQCVNTARRHRSWDAAEACRRRTQGRGKASDCVACGACEAACPQKLPIRALLREIAGELEA